MGVKCYKKFLYLTNPFVKKTGCTYHRFFKNSKNEHIRKSKFRQTVLEMLFGNLFYFLLRFIRRR